MNENKIAHLSTMMGPAADRSITEYLHQKYINPRSKDPLRAHHRRTKSIAILHVIRNEKVNP